MLFVVISNYLTMYNFFHCCRPSMWFGTASKALGTKSNCWWLCVWGGGGIFEFSDAFIGILQILSGSLEGAKVSHVEYLSNGMECSV